MVTILFPARAWSHQWAGQGFRDCRSVQPPVWTRGNSSGVKAGPGRAGGGRSAPLSLHWALLTAPALLGLCLLAGLGSYPIPGWAAPPPRLALCPTAPLSQGSAPRPWLRRVAVRGQSPALTDER